jgi:neutral ceramidase
MEPCFRIARAKIDCTPNARGQILMGWGDPEHRALEVKEPLTIRCLWIKDPQGKSILLLQYDLCMISELLRKRFTDAILNLEIAGQLQLDETSFLFSATHSHAAPGGYCGEALYQLGSLGLDEEWIELLVQKTITVVTLASADFRPAKMKCGQASIPKDIPLLHNRALGPYSRNPDRSSPTSGQALGTLPDFPVWRFESMEGKGLAVVSFLGLHGTCIHQDQQCIHPDHKGLSSKFTEERFSREDSEFLALYLQGAAGDITPNFKQHSAGDVQRGVFANDFQNAIWVAEHQCEATEKTFLEMKNAPAVSPQIQIHTSEVHFFDEEELKRRVVGPAMGESFLFSTEEGKAHQAWLTKLVLLFLGKQKTTPEQERIHGVKRIVVDGALRRLLFFYIRQDFWAPFIFRHPALRLIRKWQKEKTIDTLPIFPISQRMSVVRLGSIFLLGCPGEFTIQASLRLKKAALEGLSRSDFARSAEGKGAQFVFLGYTNGYASYVTTPEEYEFQRYEGACTLYGRETLSAYLKTVAELVARF